MGEREALFADLIARYSKLVRSAVAKVAGRGDGDLGDEILQRVSESLWKQVRAEKEILHPAAYLYRCAVRETVRQLEQKLEEAEPGALEQVAAPGALPEDELRARQVEGNVRRILSALPPERATAAKAHLAGFSVEELMQMHGWSYQKARNLIARGMADLRARLTEEGLP